MHRVPVLSILFLLAFAAVAAPASASPPVDPAAGSSAWGEPSEVLDGEAYEAWTRIRRGLARDFDQVCGDTFCEGDFTNLQPLRFLCSVHRGTGMLGACAWSFAGSEEWIGPRGVVESRRVTWQCAVPLARHTRIESFLAALDVAEPIDAPLPGTGASVYDALADCL